MRLIRSSLSSDSGFTVMELLVTSVLGFVITGLALTASISYQNVLGKDIARTRLNQNLRGSLDLIGVDIRVGGENLGAAFPAIELINGASNAPDRLIVRRNLLDEVLPVCTTVVAGSGVNQVQFAIPGTVPGCTYSGQTHNFQAWQSYRTSNGGQVPVYIFDTSAKLGEFFTYNGENDTGNSYSIGRSGSSWTNTYAASASALYVLEEWEYQLNDGLLQIITNRDTSNPLNIAFDVSDFQVTIDMQDGTTKQSFTTSDQWNQIRSVNISISGTDSFARRTMNETFSASYFPRNVLSN